MKNKPTERIILRKQIQRAVASSAAIETGKPVKALETILRNQSGKFKKLKLAG